jgi:hypothetical protein
VDFVIDLSAIATSIKLAAVFFSVVIIGYAGLIIATSSDPIARNEGKEIIAGVLIGLSILFLGPVISSVLTGGAYCPA